MDDSTSNFLIFRGDINQKGSLFNNNYPHPDISIPNGLLGNDANDFNDC